MNSHENNKEHIKVLEEKIKRLGTQIAMKQIEVAELSALANYDRKHWEDTAHPRKAGEAEKKENQLVKKQKHARFELFACHTYEMNSLSEAAEIVARVKKNYFDKEK